MASTARVIYELVGVDSASPAFERAGASASTAESRISKLGKSVAVAGAAIAAGAVAIGYESVKAAVSFQSSMEKIRTQAGGSQKDVTALSSAVLKLGTTTQQGPEELADALYHLKSVGLDNANAMKALKTASDLAALGGSNLEETTNALAGAWRTGIQGAQNFGEAAATINAIIGAGNMRMDQFVEAIGTGILASAKTFGLSLKSVGGALAVMTDEGVPAVDAATRLRMSFSLLGAPSAQANKVLKTIGLSGLQLANAMRSPGGLIAAIGLLKQHLDDSGLSASKQAQVLSEAFGGGRSSSAIMTLINNFDVLKMKQDQINAGISKYGGSVAAQRQTAAAQLKLLQSNFDVLGVRIGAALLPPVTGFVHFLASTAVPAAVSFGQTLVKKLAPSDKVKSAFNAIKAEIGDFFGGVAGGAKPARGPRPVTGPGGRAVASLPSGPAVPPVIPGLAPVMMRGRSATPNLGPAPALPKNTAKSAGSQLGKQLMGLDWSGIFASAIKGAVKSADAIGAAIVGLFKKVNWLQMGKAAAFALVPFVIGLVNNLATALISEAIHHPLDLLTFVASLIPIGRLAGIVLKVFGKIPLLGPLLRVFLGPIEKAGLGIESALGKMLKKVFGPIADRIGGYFKDAGTWLYVKGDDLLQGLGRGIGRAARSVGKWLYDYVFAPVGRYFAKAGSWLWSRGMDLIEGLGGGIWQAAKFISRWLYDYVFAPVGRYFARAGSWLWQHGIDLLNGLGNGIIRAAKSIGSWLYWNVFRPVTSYFMNVGKWLWNHGWNLIQGLFNGIVNRMKNIGSWIWGNVVSPIINWIKHHFGIHSPSTVMAGIGHNMIAGLMHGLISGDPLGAITKVFGSVPEALGHLIMDGVIDLSKLPSKVLSSLSGVLGKLGGWLGDIFGGGGGGAAAWTSAILEALKLLNQPASLLGAVQHRLMQESGGSATVVNTWDSNWARGTPSVGGMQVIGPTFARYAGPFRNVGPFEYGVSTNKLANMYAALNYAMNNYPSLYYAMMKPGGYRVGAWNLPADELAMVHRGEMIIPAKFAAAIRGAVSKGSDGATAGHTGPLVHVENMQVREPADVGLLAAKVSFAITASTLGA